VATGSDNTVNHPFEEIVIYYSPDGKDFNTHDFNNGNMPQGWFKVTTFDTSGSYCSCTAVVSKGSTWQVETQGGRTTCPQFAVAP
jgi:hypothetical protein